MPHPPDQQLALTQNLYLALSAAQAEMGNKLINVASTEAHPPLGNALRKLGRTWHSISDLDQAAGISECVIIGDSFGYQGMNAKSAKETLLQRAAVLDEHQSAVKASISKRRYIERLKASSTINPAKVDEALEDMEEVVLVSHSSEPIIDIIAYRPTSMNKSSPNALMGFLIIYTLPLFDITKLSMKMSLQH